MKIPIPQITRVYGRCIRLYPKHFGEEFGEEMQQVFADAVAEAAERGGLPLILVCLRELRDLPVIALREHWSGLRDEQDLARSVSTREEEASMAAALQTTPTTSREGSEPTTWNNAVMAILPFLAFALAVAGGFLGLMGWYVFLLLGCGVSWVKRFPRWSYPWGAPILLAACLVMAMAATVHGTLSVLAAGLLVLLMLATALHLSHSMLPLLQSAVGVWRDWTLLSFGLYGIMPLAVWISFDEVPSSHSMPFLAGSAMILAGGALAYARSSQTWPRILSLVSGTSLSWIVAMTGRAVTEEGLQAPWMVGPGNTYLVANGMVVGWGILLALMLAPLILALLRHSVESMGAA